jgi:hypothetical protein
LHVVGQLCRVATIIAELPDNLIQASLSNDVGKHLSKLVELIEGDG